MESGKIGRLRLVASLYATLLLVVAVLPAAAADASAISSADTAATTASYWGELPPPSDSTTTLFDNRARAAWEWPLHIPYAAINYPLRWVREGIGKGIRYADRKDLFRFIHLVPVPRGFVPSVFYSQQEGLGFGLDYYNSLGPERNPFRIRTKYSTETWQKYTAGLILNRGGQWELHMGGGYKLMPNLEVYGIGPGSVLDDRAFYKDERSWGGINFRRRITGSSILALGSAYSEIGASSPDEQYRPSVREKFGDGAPEGFDSRSKGVMMRAAWAFNNTVKESNPGGGTIFAVSAGGFVATNTGDVSFVATRVEIQQFVSLWHTERALALRGFCSFIENTGNAGIPFQRMFINETPDQFRGYDSGRWRDVGITGIIAEYRYPFLADAIGTGFGLDAVLLADVGQVFNRAADISTDNLTQSYGFGLRAFMNDHFVGAMELVWSEEGFQFRLSTKQLFQYSRDVLFQGREETLIH
jgi:hypothetical protein